MPVTTVRLGGRPEMPVLLLGPAAGCSVQSLWSSAARTLGRHVQVVGWDLPGHGSNVRFLPDDPSGPAAAGGPGRVTLSSLARDVLEALDRLLDTAPGTTPPPVHHAGHDVGGAVGLLLARDHPARVASVALLGCPGPPTTHQVDPGLPPGLVADHPRTAQALLAAAERTAPGAVEAVRRAHARLDLGALLEEVGHRVLLVHGAEDHRCDTPALAATTGTAGRTGPRVETLGSVAHLAPAEAPDRVAALLLEHALGPVPAAGAAAGDDGPLDARTEALVRVAAAAAAPGGAGEQGAPAVLEAARGAARAGATSAAVERTLALAWGEHDADGRLARTVGRMLRAAG